MLVEIIVKRPVQRHHCHGHARRFNAAAHFIRRVGRDGQRKFALRNGRGLLREGRRERDDTSDYDQNFRRQGVDPRSARRCAIVVIKPPIPSIGKKRKRDRQATPGQRLL